MRLWLRFALFFGLWLLISRQGIPNLNAKDKVFSGDAVKAAFLYKFIAFSKWPARDGHRKIKIGVFNDNGVFQQLGNDKSDFHRDNQMRVSYFESLAQLEKTDVLWVGTNELHETLNGLIQNGTMLIGEGVSCWRQNLHVCLLEEADGYRFKLDLYSFKQSGIQISSRVIRLAQEIRNTNND